METVIIGKEEEKPNKRKRGRSTGAKLRKEMVCSGGVQRILYALSVTCRSVLIIGRSKVRAKRKVNVCLCANRKEMQK